MTPPRRRPAAVAPPAGPTRAAVQRRAVPVLMASQVLGGIGLAAGIAVGGLLAEQVGSTSRAGLAQTAVVLGAAVLAVPLARLAERAGRRPALAGGYAVAFVGAAAVVVAAVIGSFGLLLVGMLLFGGGTASGLQARFAAVDAAEPRLRARSLATVVWATTVGAVAGPNLTGLGGRLGEAVGVPALAGPFLLAAAAFAAAALVLGLALRPDPLLVGRGDPQSAGHPDGADPAGHGPSRPGGRPSLLTTLRLVAASPPALLGLVAVAAAHAVMIGVMVMTPVHLGHEGATLRVVGLVISAHVAGMYAASPLMGWLADRAGRVPAIGVGVGLLLLALVVGASAGPGAHGVVGAALTLLGLGWSCCLVAGSTLLSEAAPATVRRSVQGLGDLVMGLAGAAAGAAAGPVLAVAGYPLLSAWAAVLLVPVVVLALAVESARRRRGAPSTEVVGGAG